MRDRDFTPFDREDFAGCSFPTTTGYHFEILDVPWLKLRSDLRATSGVVMNAGKLVLQAALKPFFVCARDGRPSEYRVSSLMTVIRAPWARKNSSPNIVDLDELGDTGDDRSQAQINSATGPELYWLPARTFVICRHVSSDFCAGA